MDLSEQNILYIARGCQFAGTEKVVQMLCEAFSPLVNKIVVCCEGNLKSYFEIANNIKYIRIPDIASKSPSVMVKTARRLRQITRSEDITLIHTHHRMAAFYIQLLGLYKGRTFINTSHNTFSDKVSLTRYSFKNAHLIACGDRVKQNLESVYQLSNVTTIRNGIKPYTGEIAPDPTIEALHEKGCIVVGNVGRLSEQKGIKYFLDAIPEVLKKHNDARFSIVGDGELKQELMHQAEDLGIIDAVSFLGYRSDVQNLMAQMDFIVLSSLWEGLPLTPIEAFSVGKTVVATAVAGTIEIVRTGKYGILVESRDAISLAEGINRMIETTNRAELEEEAKKTFNEEFSYSVFSKQYRNYYENC